MDVVHSSTIYGSIILSQQIHSINHLAAGPDYIRVLFSIFDKHIKYLVLHKDRTISKISKSLTSIL